MRKYTTYLILIAFSLFCVALVAARILYSGEWTRIFLIWNLFLAWLPVLFAALALSWRKRPFLALSMAFLWLLFLPNAPYLVTDLIHLHSRPPVPLWYDMMLLLSFAVVGLFLGFVSLRLMHGLVNGRFGAFTGWIFVMAVLAISGLGVYIGRFLRWNSWDLFVRPVPLLTDIISELSDPKTIVMSGLLATLLILAYVLFTISPGQINSQQQQSYLSGD